MSIINSKVEWQSNIETERRAHLVCEVFGFHKSASYAEANDYGKDMKVVEVESKQPSLIKVSGKGGFSDKPFRYFTRVVCILE